MGAIPEVSGQSFKQREIGKSLPSLMIRFSALFVTASFRNRFMLFMGLRVSRSLIFTGQQSSPELQACFKFDPILAIFAAMHTFSVSFHEVVSLGSLEDLKPSFANITGRMQTKSVELVLHRNPPPVNHDKVQYY